jgi:hypothetical protein
MDFDVRLTLEQIRTIALALEAADRLNSGQVMIPHELVAPASNNHFRQLYNCCSSVKETERLMKGVRSYKDNALHAEFEGLMYNFRSTFYNTIADQNGVDEQIRGSFVTYDGPEVLGYKKLEFKQVIE